MQKKLLAFAAMGLLAGPMAANALPLDFACISGSSTDCAAATSSLTWDWNGLDFTIANSGSGYVSEVYFDLGAGMTASFLSGTGGNVFFYLGANPSSLPGGSSVGFVSDFSFDSDPSGLVHNGIDGGETATFRILGATLDSFEDALAAGVHVRSLINGSASLVTVGTPTTSVPEPGTLALFGLGMLGIGVLRRRRV
ncbi:MAG TPA: PEP-CTERM sorting domain-containing protein [Steroidobacteraceae bacterium]|nr:PEP-CTERM sorting domain-containing protein [Steroidobacteraceae bacterium]